jgi:hypothetical protein
MKFAFNCCGHENILGLHNSTIEFTKDYSLTKNGDCIIGVRADFDFRELMDFVAENSGRKVECKIIVGLIEDEFSFYINPDFSGHHEIVIRKTDFCSKRTLGVLANKAAVDLNRGIMEKMRDRNSIMKVIFSSL